MAHKCRIHTDRNSLNFCPNVQFSESEQRLASAALTPLSIRTFLGWTNGYSLFAPANQCSPFRSISHVRSPPSIRISPHSDHRLYRRAHSNALRRRIAVALGDRAGNRERSPTGWKRGSRVWWGTVNGMHFSPENGSPCKNARAGPQGCCETPREQRFIERSSPVLFPLASAPPASFSPLPSFAAEPSASFSTLPSASCAPLPSAGSGTGGAVLK
jgi:hypothetical protein